MKEQVRHPLPQGESAVNWAQDTNFVPSGPAFGSASASVVSEKMSPALSIARVLCDTHSVNPALTLSVLLRFAQQPEALPSSVSLHAAPWPSRGLSSSKWPLTDSSQLASPLTPAHPPSGPRALGLGHGGNFPTQCGSETQP